MTYLLDVNALVALGLVQHEFHQRVTSWLRFLSQNETTQLATCSITELGFVRILSQAPQYWLSVLEARDLLIRVKEENLITFVFLADDQSISLLPRWVSSAKQVTDGHLLQLARAHGSALATLDRKIPGGFLIPERF